MKNSVNLFLAVMLTGFLGTSASATLIVSFDKENPLYTGGGPAGNPADNGDTWIVYSGFAPGGATGNGVNLLLTANWNQGFSWDSPTAFQGLSDDFMLSNNPSQPATFRLSGLDNSKVYDVYIIAPNPTQFTSPYGGLYTSDGQTVGATGGQVNDTAWIEGQNYAVLKNLAPSSGIIDVSAVRNPASPNQEWFGFAGVQVVEVPEPTSLVLLGAGGTLLLMRQRRFVSRN